jgi:hypothetical protein
MMDEPTTFDPELIAAFEPAYALERELSGGGMSRVFLATERALNRQVVIKVLPRDLAAGVNRERFRREIQLAAQLQHPHIVPLYAAGEHGDLLYYTMPFIEGESLRHALHESGATKPVRFAPREVVGILHDVVDALAYAHARGVIHRDIKPGNVLRSGTHAVVTDFGVAKAISAAMPAVGMTTSGMAIGTPAYMAPEQLAGDPAADQRVDIYAVGLLGYELLTGEAPFIAPSPQETMAAQLTRAPEPIEKVRADVPRELSALIMRALAKAPEKRQQNAAEMLEELDAINLPSGDYVPATRPPTRRAVLYVGGALLALAAVAVTWSVATTSEATRIAVDSAVVAATPLTRADSLAIAEAVARRLAIPQKRTVSEIAGRQIAQDAGASNAAAAAAGIDARIDSLAGVIERRLLDSLSKGARQVSAADPMRELRNQRVFAQPDSFGRGGVSRSLQSQRGQRRRVVLTEPPNPQHPELAAATHAISDTLRKFIARTRLFSVVPDDSVQAVLATSRETHVVGQALNAELFASVRVASVGSDSLKYFVYLQDLGAAPEHQRAAATINPVSVTMPLHGVDQLLAQAIGSLIELSSSPRKPVVATP